MDSSSQQWCPERRRITSKTVRTNQPPLPPHCLAHKYSDSVHSLQEGLAQQWGGMHAHKSRELNMTTSKKCSANTHTQCSACKRTMAKRCGDMHAETMTGSGGATSRCLNKPLAEVHTCKGCQQVKRSMRGSLPPRAVHCTLNGAIMPGPKIVLAVIAPHCMKVPHTVQLVTSACARALPVGAPPSHSRVTQGSLE